MNGSPECSLAAPPVRAAVLSLVLLALVGGCRKSDAERAAEERAEIDKRIRDSYALVPYRALKLTLRSVGQPNAPQEVDALWKALAATQSVPELQGTPEEARRLAGAYLDLGVAFYKAKQTLETRDEDEFPLLWKIWLPKHTPVLQGYDAGQEHLVLAGIWLLLDTADRGNRVPATDLVFYELSRATPQPTWEPFARIAARGNRGLAFCEAGYHYAAEEELTAFITESEAVPPEDFDSVRGASPERSRELTLAAGYFLRAWNRMGLKRERAAEDDLERGLKSLEKLGIENELTWWGWAFIHFRRERYEESANYLDKLAASTYVGEKERQEVKASADEMRRQGGKLPVFLQARAAVILGQALIARAGGPEKVIAAVVGPEQARQLYAPIVWLDQVRQGIEKAGPDKIAQGAGDALSAAREAGGKGLDAAREAGGKGLDALKKKLGGGSGGATAEPAPR
jgi:tetratricopeptide (TPR) repeat protein